MYRMNLTTTLEFVMRDCSSSTLLKQCNLLPQCYACLVNAASIYDMDYYLKLFSVDDQDYHFTYVDTSTPHYFTCVRGQESQACGEVMDFVDANYRTVTKRPLSEVLVSLYAVVFVVLVGLIVWLEVSDWCAIHRAMQVELELWELYLTDQSQYTSVMRSLQEEEDECSVCSTKRIQAVRLLMPFEFRHGGEGLPTALHLA